ncbi:MAG: cysteine-rich CWC family protein [Ramlibacter sp.]
MNEAATLDPARCPLCGGPNGCAMQPQPAPGEPPKSCWCNDVDFSAELLQRVPAPAVRRVCICRACALGNVSSRSDPPASP